MITTALEDEEIGVQIGGVKINNLCLTNDIAVLAESPNELQVEVSENLGMKVNIEKTEIQYIG